MLLADITEENLAFEVQADFLPTVAGDEGGVLIWNNSTETIEFLESFDAYSSVDQKAWLVVKEGQNWRFFSDSGGGYDFVDSDVMDSTKFGVMLKRGSDPSFTNMDVNSILATKGNKITVNNVLAGYRVQILNGDGTVAAEDVVGSGATAIKLQIMKLEINGTLNIFDETGTLVDTVQAIFHGGDIYSLGSEIQVRIDTTELSRIQQTDLGSMSSGYLQVKMNLYNPSNVAATNIKLAIEQYDSKFGWTWVISH
jgi:hypothetical protein